MTTMDTAAPAEGLESFKDFAQRNSAAGLYPATYATVMHLCQQRERLGLSDAFARIGYRWMVSRPKFYSLVSQRPK